MAIRFIVKQTPVPPAPTELSYDAVNSENFNATDEGFANEGDPGRNVAVTPNSSILVGWTEYSPDEFDNSTSKVNLKNIDITDTNDFSTQHASLNCNSGLAAAKLTGGNIALVYADGRSNPRIINGAVITSSGAISVGETTIDGDVGNALEVECVALNNGNFVAFYSDDNSGTFNYRYYNPSMTSIYGPASVDASYTGQYPRGTVLSGGNVAVVYKRGGFSQGTALAVFDSSGNTVLSSTIVLAGNTDGICNSITPTNDGGFVVLAAVKNGNYDNALYLYKYNSSGSLQDSITFNDPPSTDPGGGLPYDSWFATQTFKLDDGNIGIVGLSSGSKTLYCWVYDQDLTEVQSITSLLTISELNPGQDFSREARAGSFGDGKYAFVMQRRGPSGLKVYVDVIS
jgi:hypothetical protein